MGRKDKWGVGFMPDRDRDRLKEVAYGEQDFSLTLHDLWAGLVKRRYLILGVIFGFVALFSALQLTAKRYIDFASFVEIGSIPSDSEKLGMADEAVESKDVLLDRLNEIVISDILESYASEHGDESLQRISVVPRVTGAGRRLILESRSTASQEAAVAEIHRKIISNVEAEHAKRIDLMLAEENAILERVQQDVKRHRTLRDNCVRQLNQIDGFLSSYSNSPNRPRNDLGTSVFMVSLLAQRSSIQSAMLHDAQRQLEASLAAEGRLLRRQSKVRKTTALTTSPRKQAVAGPRWSKRLGVATLLGAFVGLVITFFLEFGSHLFQQVGLRTPFQKTLRAQEQL